MEISREELKEMIKTTTKAAVREVIEAHVCTQFSKSEVSTLKDVASVGRKVKIGVLSLVAASIIAGIAAAFSSISNMDWTWWKG